MDKAELKRRTQKLDLVTESKVLPLRKEANELTAIFTAIGKTAKENQKSKILKN